MTLHPVLIAGAWQAADASREFQAENPATGQPLPDRFPVSRWSDLDAALTAAAQAATAMRRLPAGGVADFLERYAQRIEDQGDALVVAAHLETALPSSPRLADVELPRTTAQLRQAAQAAREGSWALATIDTQLGIRAAYAPLGPVAVFGPNNFPFAFGSVSGGDFAAAIAAGNPVIAKANSSHPNTTRLLAIEARAAAQETGLPEAAVQLLYRVAHDDGERLAGDPRLGAIGYTGSRAAGLRLKAAADAAGKPIYLELSSINPVVILPGALRERSAQLVQDFTSSCLMGSGQFCTNPGLILLLEGPESREFIRAAASAFEQAPAGVLLSRSVRDNLLTSLQKLATAGAHVLCGNAAAPGDAYRCANTLLQIEGERFLAAPAALQTEAFGNASLIVVARDTAQAAQVLEHLEGNLTGCIYSDTAGSDDATYDLLAPMLRQKVGRLLNDKMPTGVAVSPAMNHGGPFPATGHPGFTAVGIPASMLRFAMLQCYDGVRPPRLPLALADTNPNGRMWRRIDGIWTQGDVG